ncbi:hypothetical protein ACT6QH_12440 [Xanthobacter sp. TB0139]|uniref:hypothetical protein n=1 Tax=Xanthobacter sp. TB0139 TaxID=3459178 RepID=UPI004038FFD6
MWLDELRPLTMGPPGADWHLNEAAFRPFGINRIRTERGLIAVRTQVVATLPFGQLRIFTRTGAPVRRRILVVAPMAGGYPFLLRDLVVALLGVAEEVGITEWPNARYVPLSAGAFDFAANCIETTQMIRAMAARAPAEAPLHVVGVCQGGVPALAGASILAEMDVAPLSLTLMGGPIDSSRNPTRLWRLLQTRAAESLEKKVVETVPPRFPGAGRQVFPGWRQTDTFAFYLWRQAVSGGRLPFQLAFDDGDDPWRYPLARLCWTLMDVPAEFFISNVEILFRANALAQGLLEISGHRVRPQYLRHTALLTVEGAEDDISGPSQTEAAHGLCPNIPRRLHQHLLVQGAGHFALFYGHAMRQSILPAIIRTMKAGEAQMSPQVPVKAASVGVG